MSALKKRTIHISALLSCIFLLLLNLISSLLLILTYGRYLKLFFYFGVFSICICSLLFYMGLFAFLNRKRTKTIIFGVSSIVFGAVQSSILFICPIFVEQICSLNQIAYRGCQDFSLTPCAIWNTCLKNELLECMAPPEELCETDGKSSTLMVTLSLFYLIFSSYSGTCAFMHYNKLELERNTELHKSRISVAPSKQKERNVTVEESLRKQVLILEKALAETNSTLGKHRTLLQLYGEHLGYNKRNGVNSSRQKDASKNSSADESTKQNEKQPKRRIIVEDKHL